MKKKPPNEHHYYSEEEDAKIFREFLEAETRLPDKDKAATDEAKKSTMLGRSSPATRATLDVHGLTSPEATHKVTGFIEEALAKLGPGQIAQLRIITGKGRHSVGGQGVLIRDVYHFVVQRYSQNIKKIDSPPSELLVQGVPIRGHFDIEITKSK